MIFEHHKKYIRHQYTIIELLVVLVIAGLLTGLTVSGLKSALARQGAAGAVRTIASKISLAQSFAVSKNRYVALLAPDFKDLNNNSLSGNKDDYKVSDYTDNNSWHVRYVTCFTKNRLCYVTKDTSGATPVYKFDSWVKGYEWQDLPSKTVAFITVESDKDSSSNFNNDSTPVEVQDIPDPTDLASTPGKVNSTALIFKPSGALVNANQVVVRVFRAAYLPYQSTGSEKVFYWQGSENENKGWKIVVNGFSGRTQFCLGGEDVDN